MYIQHFGVFLRYLPTNREQLTGTFVSMLDISKCELQP